MTLTADPRAVQSRMDKRFPLDFDVTGLSGLEILDEFLRRSKEREMFTRREVVDLLLDIRFSLQNHLTSSE